MLNAPSKPEDPMEIERHDRCRGASRVAWERVENASHFRSPAVREAAQIQIDFCFLREDEASCDVDETVPENPWATILFAVDVATQNPLEIALPGKNAELEYAVGQIFCIIKRIGYTELVIRSDGEPSITAIVDRIMAEIKKTWTQARL